MPTKPRTSQRRTTTATASVTLLVALTGLTGGGCGTVKTSGTARTATEQLLLTNAWDSALQKVDFRQLAGVPVFLDTTNVTAVDQGWVVSSLRQAMLTQGVLLRQKAEQAQWVVEARVGAYGTDEKSWLLGIPQTTVPPTVTGLPTGTIPKIPIAEKNDQRGVAKLALFAYDRASGQLVWRSGTMLAVATAKDVSVLGIGPIESGSIRDGTEFAGIRLPLPNENPPPDSPEPRKRRLRPFAAPVAKDPSSLYDRDSFGPP